MSRDGQLEHGARRRAGADGGSSPPRSTDARGAGGDTGGARGAPSRRAQAALPLATVGAGMHLREVSVRAPDVVFVKGVVEASDGLASVFAERGGELLLAAPYGREAELDELLADLEREIGARPSRGGQGGGGWQQDRQGR